MMKIIELRKQSDIRRYKKIYKINPYEKKHYDFVIDTTTKTPEEICRIIIKKLKKEILRAKARNINVKNVKIN